MASGPRASTVMSLTIKYVMVSLLHLAIGTTLIALTMLSILPFSLTAFYFMQLYGFVANMIIGLSYLLIPSFSRKYLYSLAAAKIHFLLSNSAVILLTISFSGMLDLPKFIPGMSLAALALSVYLHVSNIFMTIRSNPKADGDRLLQISR
ncbi:MAG: hypothetical protein FJ358_05105 [Thaumarchaeota archaeon]|nr:hypothetical protein [Nitrososphaerota archaeon]